MVKAVLLQSKLYTMSHVVRVDHSLGNKYRAIVFHILGTSLLFQMCSMNAHRYMSSAEVHRAAIGILDILSLSFI